MINDSQWHLQKAEDLLAECDSRVAQPDGMFDRAQAMAMSASAHIELAKVIRWDEDDD